LLRSEFCPERDLPKAAYPQVVQKRQYAVVIAPKAEKAVKVAIADVYLLRRK